MRVNEFRRGYITLLVVSLILGWVKIGATATGVTGIARPIPIDS